MSRDLLIGTEVFDAIGNAAQATRGQLLRARLFGEKRVIDHLGMRHTLKRYSGVWYHTHIREL